MRGCRFCGVVYEGDHTCFAKTSPSPSEAVRIVRLEKAVRELARYAVPAENLFNDATCSHLRDVLWACVICAAIDVQSRETGYCTRCRDPLPAGGAK